MAFSHLRRFQNLFIVVAHSEVRQRGLLSVAEQQRLLMEAYVRNIRIWYNQDATLLSVPNMPVCPASIAALGSQAAVVRCMLASTNTGRMKLTGESMLNRFVDIKKQMMHLIAHWNVACKAAAQVATIAGNF
jgi:hypothetical protein